MATVETACSFGAIELDKDISAKAFKEKPADGNGWINGGYFVLNRSIFNYIDNDASIWEREPFEKLALENELMAYQHKGYWQPVDTLREKIVLEKLWQ